MVNSAVNWESNARLVARLQRIAAPIEHSDRRSNAQRTLQADDCPPVEIRVPATQDRRPDRTRAGLDRLRHPGRPPGAELAVEDQPGHRGARLAFCFESGTCAVVREPADRRWMDEFALLEELSNRGMCEQPGVVCTRSAPRAHAGREAEQSAVQAPSGDSASIDPEHF